MTITMTSWTLTVPSKLISPDTELAVIVTVLAVPSKNKIDKYSKCFEALLLENAVILKVLVQETIYTTIAISQKCYPRHKIKV